MRLHLQADRRWTEEPVSTTRVRVSRRIGAEPTSTALLLAGPTALELWPGVRRVGEVGGRALVEAELQLSQTVLERSPTAAAVIAHPPRRTPTSFVTRFAWTGPGLPVTDGVLTLSYAPGLERLREVSRPVSSATEAELVLDADGLSESRMDEQALTGMAEGFLANLARAAERRRSAA